MSSMIQSTATRTVRSYDIFDTLIARTVTDPTEVFDIVERAGAPGFKALRLKAQAQSNHTWADIYRQLQVLSGIGSDEVAQLQKLELAAEASVSYLISETYQQVQDGDILVSDMYLPAEALAALLNSVGFTKNVGIYVSPAGKASGQVWSELQKQFEIAHHLGDNRSSDFDSPSRHGIRASHYVRSLPNLMERFLHSSGAVQTAAFLRRFRLTNPFGIATREGQLHELQAGVNLPFLLLMAQHIDNIMKREGLSRLLFTTRDSCLLQPIYSLLFPETDARTFHTSRVAFKEQRPEFVAYVKRMYEPGRTLIFDLHGAFKSGRALFEQLFGALPRIHIFSCAPDRAPSYPDFSFDVHPGSNHVESLNLDRVGSLSTVDAAGRPVRMPVEPAMAEIGAIYRTICARFVEEMRPQLDVVRAELSKLSQDVPWVQIHQLIREAVVNTPTVARATLSEHRSLTQIMNEANSDKGSTYACAHCYTFVYERLLQELGPREHLSLLEIGLNRDGHDDIPSLKGWQAYLGSKATLYGADIHARFKVHHDPANRIHILTADQSKRADLVRCGLASPTGYDVIIDDGSHLSSHQQISLSVLWQFVRPGGLYIIEDLHYQPHPEAVMTTRELLQSWKTGTPMCTPHVSSADVIRILGESVSIEFHDSLSPRWGDAAKGALVVIRKRAS